MGRDFRKAIASVDAKIRKIPGPRPTPAAYCAMLRDLLSLASGDIDSERRAAFQAEIDALVVFAHSMSGSPLGRLSESCLELVAKGLEIANTIPGHPLRTE